MEKIRTYFLFLTIFVTGGVILIIEIAGTRILAPFYGSTIFVWSALITITLGFLALGYFLGGKIADKYPKASVLYFILFLGGISAFLIIKFNQPLLVFTDKFGLRFGPLVAALILFSLPLCLLSMAGPFVIRLRSLMLQKIGSIAGYVYGITTIGSLVGALLVGFWLIPNFSVIKIFSISAGLIIVLSIIGLFLERSSTKIKSIAIFILLISLLIPKAEYKDLEHQVKIIHQEPSFYADLKVVELPYVSTLLMDGAPQSVFSKSISKIFADESVEINRALNSWPSDAEVLVLGFGAGTLAEFINPELRVDYIELDPKTVKLAEQFFNFSLDANDRMIINDARAFLRKTDKTYDFIFVDLYKGSMIPIHTHTKEALDLMKTHLKPGGILVSNILGSSDDIFVKSLIKTLKATFPNVILGAKEKGFSNLLAYASMDTNYYPEFGGRHNEVKIDDSLGVIITDDKNPLEILASKRVDVFHKKIIKVFGYQVLFSI